MSKKTKENEGSFLGFIIALAVMIGILSAFASLFTGGITSQDVGSYIASKP